MTPINYDKYKRHTEELRKKFAVVQSMIANMCSEGRGPRMTIPASESDEDIYITKTISELIEHLEQDSLILQRCMELEEDVKSQETKIEELRDLANNLIECHEGAMFKLGLGIAKNDSELLEKAHCLLKKHFKSKTFQALSRAEEGE